MSLQHTLVSCAYMHIYRTYTFVEGKLHVTILILVEHYMSLGKPGYRVAPATFTLKKHFEYKVLGVLINGRL